MSQLYKTAIENPLDGREHILLVEAEVSDASHCESFLVNGVVKSEDIYDGIDCKILNVMRVDGEPIGPELQIAINENQAFFADQVIQQYQHEHEN